MDFIPQDASSDGEEDHSDDISFKPTNPPKIGSIGIKNSTKAIPSHVRSSSISTTNTTNSQAPAKFSPIKSMWCHTVWTNLSMQAKKLNLPELPYFAPNGLLSREVNEKLWKQVGRLFDFLGPEKARYATPVMAEFGEVTWHSFIGDDKGIEVEIYHK